MKLRHFIVMLYLLVFSSGAYAYRCAIDMRKIDETLAKKPAITETQEAEVRKLRAEGETLHNKGKHTEALEALHQALEILDVQ
ncbi:hypothetical protein [Nitrosomonas communis]|uniref:Tetratricopeptide repeat protein n=1 Tax=Nitrosomonas communis TaxID=44574 RepID=A0A1I4SZE8_9PROT|nr:hypothetical protein [Nitrosomonas communis]SFM69795.1 hypothetical protein SAMN05421863_104512 [Nitrosomonas communis]